MCGITGLYASGLSREWLPALKAMMTQSQIRGLHAGGAAWLSGPEGRASLRVARQEGGLSRLDVPLNLAEAASADGTFTVRVALHARYSTSDLAHNQPLAAEGRALTHNGVISQEPPERWQALYGLACDGSNDSELLLRRVLAHPAEHPLEAWPEASIAAALLSEDGSLTLTRNGKRPLYVVTDLTGRLGRAARGVAWASTRDVLIRAGWDPGAIRPLPAGEAWDWAAPEREPVVRCLSVRSVPDLILSRPAVAPRPLIPTGPLAESPSRAPATPPAPRIPSC